MPASLDLRKAHKYQHHGDLVVVLTWVNDERSLVLLPAMRRDATWFVVPEGSAFAWAVDHWAQDVRRDAMLHAVRQSEVACDMLGIEPTKRNKARVISIITGWLPDLIRMPSAPPPEFKPGSWGQQIMRADGVPFAAEELRDEVEGVTYG